MSCAHSVARSCAQPCARAVNARWGSSYPASLALLWPLKLSDSGVLKSAKGPAPVFTDTPTVTVDGVTPGDGPSFTSVVTWTDGGTRVIRFTATTASADLVGDVEIGGGFWASADGLEFRDGTNVATCATSWASGEVVTGVVQISTGGMEMSISADGTTYGTAADFDGTMPAFEFTVGAPGSLFGVQEWSKLANAQEISRYNRVPVQSIWADFLTWADRTAWSN